MTGLKLSSNMKSPSEKHLISSSSKHPAGYVLVIHGGAGTMSKKTSTPEKIAAYRAALRDALQAGYDILSEGGEAMDATVAAVRSMEGTVWITKSQELPQ